jgi:hypothetical protein
MIRLFLVRVGIDVSEFLRLGGDVSTSSRKGFFERPTIAAPSSVPTASAFVAPRTSVVGVVLVHRADGLEV